MSNFFSVGDNTPPTNLQQEVVVVLDSEGNLNFIKPLIASDNMDDMDDMEDNDFDVDRPEIPGHATSEIEHANG